MSDAGHCLGRTMVIRPASLRDIPGIWKVRYSVAENILVPGTISGEVLERALQVEGRGWVAENAQEIRGFAIGLATGNLWALFVHPAVQGTGVGSRLHDRLMAWFASQPVQTLWLSTGGDTKARRFYEARGWRYARPLENGEVRLERRNRD